MQKNYIGIAYHMLNIRTKYVVISRDIIWLKKIYILLLLVRPPCPNGIRIVGWWCSTPCTDAKETLDSVP